MATTEPGPSPTSQAPRKPACAVTFGRSTLLGRHLAAALAASGRWSAVAVLDPSPLPAAPPASPLAHFSVDLSDPAAPLARALAGAAAVFHVDPTSAAAASDGSFLSLHRLAAEGTRRLLAACRASGVVRVVYTGSADVVATGALDVIGADEGSVTYPDKFGNAASELRAQVEMMVLSADGNGGMRTCVLRPSNLFGPGDSSLLRFVAGYARSPLSSKFVIGSGRNRSDFTYVENVAHANICAEQALCSDTASVAGKPFFITNGAPVETWEFMSCMMEAMGCQRPRINLPAKMLFFASQFSNIVYLRFGLQLSSTPLLCPDTVYFLSRTRTFNTSRARKLLGYDPIVSLEDGIMRTAGSISELPDILDVSKKQGSCGSSKADKLLGGGIASDILLWRDEKKTFSYITLVFLLFYWFLLSDRTFVSSSAKILLVISLALYIHGVLPSKVFGFAVEKVTPDYFEISDSTLRNPIVRLASLWNGGIHKLRVLAQGDDWCAFLKVCMQPVDNTVLEDFFY